MDENSCKTLYPIMLVHGTAMSDRRNQRCWGRIPGALEAQGAAVCFGRQDAWGSTPSNAKQLAVSLDKALADFGTEKANIIAHSKGGLDARALAAMPGYADKIASITTISTPHRGIGWLSRIWPLAACVFSVLTVLGYPFFRLAFGDKRPNIYKLMRIMTRKGAGKFNLATPDLAGIYYQSYAGEMPPGSRAGMYALSRWAFNREGEKNDGLVAVDSAMWGEFRGTFTGGGKRGLSHADEIDYFRRDWADNDILNDGENTYTDVPQIYMRIVNELKNLGY